MAARDILLQLHASLEAYAPLVALTGHKIGATTLQSGARIIGDAVRLRPHPVPGIVLGLGLKTAGRGGPSQPEKIWAVTLTVYGRDVFEVAAMLDALETWAADTRWTNSGIRRVLWESAQQVEVTEEQQFIAAIVNLSVVYL